MTIETQDNWLSGEEVKKLLLDGRLPRSRGDKTIIDYIDIPCATFRRDVDLRGTTIEGRCEFDGATFEGWLNFENANFLAGASLMGAIVQGDNAGISFENATMLGELVLTSVTIARGSHLNLSFKPGFEPKRIRVDTELAPIVHWAAPKIPLVLYHR